MTANVNSTWAEQASTPGTPGADKQKLYPKSDGFWYILGDDAAEHQVVTEGSLAANIELKNTSETAAIDTSSGTTHTVDLQDGNVHQVTLDGDCTFTFSNPAVSGTASSFTLILIQDGSGGHTPTFPGTVKWAGGSAPTITATASAIDILTFLTTDGGTSWYGFAAGLDMQTP